MEVIAVDLGYGNVKRATNGESGTPVVDVWPACAVPVRDAGIDFFGKARPADVVLDDVPWYVGVDPEDAVDAVQTQHIHYVETPAWKAHLLYALTHGLPGPHKSGQRLVLGLPVDEWNTLARREAVAAIARDVARLAGREPIDILVLPQPMGAYVYCNSRRGGDLTKRNTLVIDVGYTTLDWTLFRRGHLQRSGTGTTRVGGVSAICEGVRRRLLEEDGAHVSDARLRSALRNGGKLLVNSEERDCQDLIHRVSEDVVARGIGVIQRSLLTQFDTTADGISDIILSGGGSSFYRAATHALLPKVRCLESADPVRDNVQGFLFYGVHRG